MCGTAAGEEESRWSGNLLVDSSARAISLAFLSRWSRAQNVKIKLRISQWSGKFAQTRLTARQQRLPAETSPRECEKLRAISENSGCDPKITSSSLLILLYRLGAKWNVPRLFPLRERAERSLRRLWNAMSAAPRVSGWKFKLKFAGSEVRNQFALRGSRKMWS